MKRKKETTYPIQKMGKYTSYLELEYGSIKIPSYHHDTIDKLMDRRNAVDNLLGIITRHCNDLLIPITKEIDEFWQSIMDDYGIDARSKRFTYDRGTKLIFSQKREDNGRITG